MLILSFFNFVNLNFHSKIQLFFKVLKLLLVALNQQNSLSIETLFQLLQIQIQILFSGFNLTLVLHVFPIIIIHILLFVLQHFFIFISVMLFLFIHYFLSISLNSLLIVSVIIFKMSNFLHEDFKLCSVVFFF